MPFWTVSFDTSNFFTLEHTENPVIDPVDLTVIMLVEWKARGDTYATSLVGTVVRLECLEGEDLVFRVYIMDHQCSVFVRSSTEHLCVSPRRRRKAAKLPCVSWYSGASLPGV